MRSPRPQGLLVLAAPAALFVAAPSPTAALASLGHPAADDPFDALVAAAALLAWLLAGWLLVTTAAVAAERAPGFAGRVGARVARRVAPLALRRLLGAGVGLTVATGALAGTPAWAGQGLPPAPPPSVSLDWPGAARPPAPPPSVSLDWPSAAPPPATPVTPAAPAPAGATQGRLAEQVVVQPGDSLWAIAAAHLPDGAPAASVAAAWPAWWSANRTVVGPDPDLIQAGQHLVPPAQP